VRYLGLALYAEGPTDHQFLGAVLRRLTEDVCLHATADVEIGEVMPLECPRQMKTRKRAEKVQAAARAAEGAYGLLFIHADGAGDPLGARSQQIQPAMDLLVNDPGAPKGSAVAVVPVRETEAWALADSQALRAAFGTTVSDAELGLPKRPAEVERILDPKRLLRDVHNKAAGPRAARRTRTVSFLPAIAERVALQRLRMVPAFQALEADLATALRALNFLPHTSGNTDPAS
jgi:hypothetical protein